MRGDHARFQHQAHANMVDSHVIADGVKVPDTKRDGGCDQVFRYAAKPKASNHQGGAVRDISDGGFG